MTPAARQTAEERREAIIDAARREFAEHGYAGASTEDIARLAGISQPYLFRLFGTKKELFLAAVRSCFGKCWDAFEQAGREARLETSDPGCVLGAMGDAYARLLEDRSALQMQLQAYAASGDPEIRDAVREQLDTLYERVAFLSGADPTSLYDWFSKGMLHNVEAALADAAGRTILVTEKGGHKHA